jgi:hypothetical protein
LVSGIKVRIYTSTEGIESRVLRRIFGPKRDETVGGYKRFHNEELYNLCSSTNIIRMFKSRRIKWAGHVAGMRIRGMHEVFWWESQKERKT